MKSYLVTFTSRDGVYHRCHPIAHDILEALRISLQGETEAPIRIKVEAV
jgi:hypothetical protein